MDIIDTYLFYLHTTSLGRGVYGRIILDILNSLTKAGLGTITLALVVLHSVEPGPAGPVTIWIGDGQPKQTLIGQRLEKEITA